MRTNYEMERTLESLVKTGISFTMEAQQDFLSIKVFMSCGEVEINSELSVDDIDNILETIALDEDGLIDATITAYAKVDLNQAFAVVISNDGSVQFSNDQYNLTGVVDGDTYDINCRVYRVK